MTALSTSREKLEGLGMGRDGVRSEYEKRNTQRSKLTQVAVGSLYVGFEVFVV